MDSWRIVWRDGFGPVLFHGGAGGPPRCPEGRRPPLGAGRDDHAAPADVRAGLAGRGRVRPGLCGWLGEGLSTVGEVEEFFARACFEADERLASRPRAAGS